MDNPAAPAAAVNVEQLLHLHTLTKDLSKLCQKQLRGYLDGMALLFRPRRMLGDAMEGAERESDGEVVDTDRQPGEDQPPAGLAIRCGNSRVVAADGLGDGPGAGGDEQAGADPAGGVAKGLSQAAAEHESGDRHAGLEQAEDNADLQPGTGAGAGDPDADRDGEVRQAEGHRDQDQGEHVITVLRRRRREFGLP